jgi:hypothetical protein
MATEQRVMREKLVLTYEGGMAEKHEMGAAVLGEALQEIANLTQQTNKLINGKGALLNPKIKGGFNEGSFQFTVLLDYIGAVLPLMPQIVETIKSVISLKYFLNGEPPQKTEQTEKGVSVQNNKGETMVVSQPVYAINSNVAINNCLGRCCKPLNEGIESIAFAGGATSEKPAVVKAKDKDLFIPIDPLPKQDSSQRMLEVLTPNVDGKAAGWRFYDLEDSVEFTARVMDDNFLTDVKNKRYSFQSGDILTVALTVVKKTINQKKYTDRIINAVLDHERPIVEA